MNSSKKGHGRGGIRNYLFYENFSRISLYIPAIKEQQKIADCLSSLDEYLNTQTEKLEALKAHKERAHCNTAISCCKVETAPKLRLRFRYSGEWSHMHGDILFEPISNKNHNSDLPILAITQDYGANDGVRGPD